MIAFWKHGYNIMLVGSGVVPFLPAFSKAKTGIFARGKRSGLWMAI
jgi:hypothetical protein